MRHGQDDDKERVREATDLVKLIGEHVALQSRGREWVGVCPFHDDHRPSMAVVTHKDQAFYKCHSCGAGGDAFTFVMEFHQMGFREALEYLADRAGITLTRDQAPPSSPDDPASIPREALRKANAYAAAFYVEQLHDEAAGAIARETLAERDITEDMIERFQIGVAPDAWDGFLSRIAHKESSVRVAARAGLLRARNTGDGHYDTFRNRLIFPIHDDSGRPIAFGARRIKPDDEPKYLNSPESPIFQKSRTLYGMHQARRSMIDSRVAIVTEGYTDVIACHQHGITNVVGTLGTALTDDHARILNRVVDTVVLLFDGDEAGQRAADRGIEVFFQHPLNVRVCVLPDGADPDELLSRENGRAQFDAAIESAVDALPYAINRVRAQLDKETSLAGREKRLDAFLRDLARLGLARVDGVRKQYALGTLSPLYGRSMEDLNHQLIRLAPTERRGPTPSNETAEPIDAPPMGSAARRRAEADVLGTLIAGPALIDRMVPHDVNLTVGAWLGDIAIVDAIHRDLITAMASIRATGDAVTVSRLMDELVATPAARGMVPDLYLRGARDDDEDEGMLANRLDSAIRALNDEIVRAQTEAAVSQGRERLASSPDAALAANELIEHIRRRGGHASAIGQGRS
ncbi:MAG: DNA primase [Planctomycetota bacterium]